MQPADHTQPIVRQFYRMLLAAALVALPVVWWKNNDLFWLINCNRENHALNFVFLLLTSLADGLWVIMIATVAQSIRPHNLMALIIALVAGNIFLQSGKYLADFDRPLRIFGDQAVCLLGQPLTVRSFPSGHAFSAGLLFMFMRPRRSLALAIIWVMLAGAAALSRVYVGVHFPRDVLAGFLIAVFAFKFAERAALRISFHDSSLMARRWAFALFSLGVSLIYLFAYHEKTQELEFLLTPAAYAILAYWLFVIGRLIAFRPQPGGSAKSGS